MASTAPRRRSTPTSSPTPTCATQQNATPRSPHDHVGPRPTGGVGGTRLGIKCLHAHWAWHLAGGDDPVGRWIAARLEADSRAGTPSDRVVVTDGECRVNLRDGTAAVVPWGPANLTTRWFQDDDPPRPEALTNALGTIADHLDDIIREHPATLDVHDLEFAGATIESLAFVEVGAGDVDHVVLLTRVAADEIFRMLATEPSRDRADQPGLRSAHVEQIIATCCIVLAFMRRLHLDHIKLLPPHGA